MKLLLTSAGIGSEKIRNFLIANEDFCIDKRIAYFFSIRKESDWKWQDIAGGIFEDMGVKYGKFNISEDISLDGIGDYDVFYIAGGNTFYILDRLRKTGLDKLIVGEVRKGKPYIGVSAGSIIAGKDIEIAGWGESGDENDIGLEDLSGFDLTPLVIYPHFEETLREELEGYKSSHSGKEVIEITDDEAVYINGENVLLI